MAIVKVLISAFVLGLLFAALSLFFLENIERATRGNAAVVQIGLVCVGGILGGIAGGAQAIVDAIEKKSSP